MKKYHDAKYRIFRELYEQQLAHRLLMAQALACFMSCFGGSRIVTFLLSFMGARCFRYRRRKMPSVCEVTFLKSTNFLIFYVKPQLLQPVKGTFQNPKLIVQLKQGWQAVKKIEY